MTIAALITITAMFAVCAYLLITATTSGPQYQTRTCRRCDNTLDHRSFIAEHKGNWHYRCQTCDLYSVYNLEHALP